MRFTVVWFPSAQARLTELWLSASDKQRVTDAANRIDKLLAADPLGIGESRTAKVRLLVELPLAVYYQVSLDDMKVEVRGVWCPPE